MCLSIATAGADSARRRCTSDHPTNRRTSRLAARGGAGAVAGLGEAYRAGTVGERAEIARTSTDSELLAVAIEGGAGVRRAAAAAPGLTATQSRFLASFPDRWTRQALAENPRADPAIIEALTADASAPVRAAATRTLAERLEGRQVDWLRISKLEVAALVAGGRLDRRAIPYEDEVLALRGRWEATEAAKTHATFRFVAQLAERHNLRGGPVVTVTGAEIRFHAPDDAGSRIVAHIGLRRPSGQFHTQAGLRNAFRRAERTAADAVDRLNAYGPATTARRRLEDRAQELHLAVGGMTSELFRMERGHAATVDRLTARFGTATTTAWPQDAQDHNAENVAASAELRARLAYRVDQAHHAEVAVQAAHDAAMGAAT